MKLKIYNKSDIDVAFNKEGVNKIFMFLSGIRYYKINPIWLNCLRIYIR